MRVVKDDRGFIVSAQCQRCGTEVVPTAKICPSCGTQLTTGGKAGRAVLIGVTCVLVVLVVAALMGVWH